MIKTRGTPWLILLSTRTWDFRQKVTRPVLPSAQKRNLVFIGVLIQRRSGAYWGAVACGILKLSRPGSILSIQGRWFGCESCLWGSQWHSWGWVLWGWGRFFSLFSNYFNWELSLNPKHHKVIVLWGIFRTCSSACQCHAIINKQC